jgi:hypothetical protein
MNRIGETLVVVGVALFVVPMADTMGWLGYFLFGSAFVLAGSLLAFWSL